MASSDYHTVLTSTPVGREVSDLARRLFVQTFRFDCQAPGFSLISLTTPPSSAQLRRLLVDLKSPLSDLLCERTGKYLAFRAMARFDQQVTTKFHRDGGADESFLMLGYEPSDVESSLALADYTLASHDMGITPRIFERDFNPMYRAGEKLLQNYVTPLTEFDPAQSNILLINNCCLPLDVNQKNLLGVMHQATIPHPDSTKPRIINSIMLRTSSSVDDDDLTPQQQLEFTRTAQVSGSSYAS